MPEKFAVCECVCVIGKVLYIKFAPHLRLLICVYALDALGALGK